MNLKRFSIRFNLDDKEDLKAWERIHQFDDGFISKEIIRIINRSYELPDLEALIRKAVSEELEKAKLVLSSSEPVISDLENENTVMDFLDSF
jgi:hypothetical protein